MIVLGLDASLDRIGWGSVRWEPGREPAPLACGVERVRPGGKDDTPDGIDHRRPQLIREAVRRIAHVGIDYHAEPSEPVAVYLEAPYVGSNPQTAVGLCIAVGSAWQAADALASGYWPAQLLAPDEWKRHAEVPKTPKVPGSRKNLAGVALRHHAVSLAHEHLEPALADELLDVKPEKPLVYLRARLLGFEPAGSQDAADGGLIAYAGAVVNAGHLAAV